MKKTLCLVTILLLPLGLLWAGGAQEEQPEAAITAIRWLAALGPAVFLAISLWFARGYPLTRSAHEDILARLAERARRRPTD